MDEWVNGHEQLTARNTHMAAVTTDGVYRVFGYWVALARVTSLSLKCISFLELHILQSKRPSVLET